MLFSFTIVYKWNDPVKAPTETCVSLELNLINLVFPVQPMLRTVLKQYMLHKTNYKQNRLKWKNNPSICIYKESSIGYGPAQTFT